MLPDRSILIRQKLVGNGKIEKFKCDILGVFQTLCNSSEGLGEVSGLWNIAKISFISSQEKGGFLGSNKMS